MNKERLKEVIKEVLRGKMPVSEQAKLEDELCKEISKNEEELREEAEWIFDESYQGAKREVYICSKCGHWQGRKKKENSKKIMYMRYCPYCGRKMKIRGQEV